MIFFWKVVTDRIATENTIINRNFKCPQFLKLITEVHQNSGVSEIFNGLKKQETVY